MPCGRTSAIASSSTSAGDRRWCEPTWPGRFRGTAFTARPRQAAAPPLPSGGCASSSSSSSSLSAGASGATASRDWLAGVVPGGDRLPEVSPATCPPLCCWLVPSETLPEPGTSLSLMGAVSEPHCASASRGGEAAASPPAGSSASASSPCCCCCCSSPLVSLPSSSLSCSSEARSASDSQPLPPRYSAGFQRGVERGR